MTHKAVFSVCKHVLNTCVVLIWGCNVSMTDPCSVMNRCSSSVTTQTCQQLWHEFGFLCRFCIFVFNFHVSEVDWRTILYILLVSEFYLQINSIFQSVCVTAKTFFDWRLIPVGLFFLVCTCFLWNESDLLSGSVKQPV